MIPVLAAGALIGTGYYRKSLKHQNVSNIDPIPPLDRHHPASPEHLRVQEDSNALILPVDKSMSIEDARDIEYQHAEDARQRNPIEPGTYSELTGIYMDDMGHNNMLPFFTRNAGTQHTDHHGNLTERRMDTFTGASAGMLPLRSSDESMLHEQSPLFEPTAGYGLLNGMDILPLGDMEQYMNTAIARQGEKPFEPQQVGPGIAVPLDVASSGGFHDARINDIMLPPNIDELRVAPKKTYESRATGPQFNSTSVSAPYEGTLGAMAPISRPRDYVNQDVLSGNSSDGNAPWSFLRTLGAWIFPRTTSTIHTVPETNRDTTGESDWYGTADAQHKAHYEQSMTESVRRNNRFIRPESATWEPDIGKIFSGGVGDKDDYGRKSIIQYRRNRTSVLTNRESSGQIMRFIQKMVLPPIDPVRTTLKEQLTSASSSSQSMIISGGKGGGGGGGGMFRPTVPMSQHARTTLKEQLTGNSETSSASTIIGGGRSGGNGGSGMFRPTIPMSQNARTTTKEQLTGNSDTVSKILGGGKGGGMFRPTVPMSQNTRTTLKEQLNGSSSSSTIVDGGAGIFRHTVPISHDARTTIRDTSLVDDTNSISNLKSAQNLHSIPIHRGDRVTIRETLQGPHTLSGNIASSGGTHISNAARFVSDPVRTTVREMMSNDMHTSSTIQPSTRFVPTFDSSGYARPSIRETTLGPDNNPRIGQITNPRSTLPVSDPMRTTLRESTSVDGTGSGHIVSAGVPKATRVVDPTDRPSATTKDSVTESATNHLPNAYMPAAEDDGYALLDMHARPTERETYADGEYIPQASSANADAYATLGSIDELPPTERQMVAERTYPKGIPYNRHANDQDLNEMRSTSLSTLSAGKLVVPGRTFVNSGPKVFGQ